MILWLTFLKSLKVKIHITIIINELICLDLLQNNPSGGETGGGKMKHNRPPTGKAG